MKKLLASLLIFGFTSMAHATLIGDTVTLNHAFPTFDTVHGITSSTTVVAGTSDTLTDSYPYYYNVNVEADSIIINILNGSVWNTSVEFNGFMIDGLNDSSGLDLTGVSVDQTVAGWSDARLTFDADSIWVNLIEPYASQSYLANGTIELGLTFGNGSTSVPEPASLALMGLGLAGLGFARRRKQV